MFKKLSVLILFLCATQAFAGFGGGRSGGFSSSRSFSSGSSFRSSGSFGGFRSSGASSFRSSPAPIYRPAPSTPTRIYSGSSSNTTVVHHDSGPGFFTGMLWGSMMNRQPVVVAGGAPVVGQTAIVEERSSFYTGLQILLVLTVIGLVIWLCVWLLSGHRRYYV